jgi:tetratricopeptide (TPR) repeat protein
MLSIESKYRSLSCLENEEIGRRLYRDKNYSEAVKAFDAVRTRPLYKHDTNRPKAILLCNGAPITALDSRAGTYEKLQEYAAALEDAKRMIRLDQANVKVNITLDQNAQRELIYWRAIFEQGKYSNSKARMRPQSKSMVEVSKRFQREIRPRM